jgi:hypothetical protein
MAATEFQIDTYITDIRSAITDYGDGVARKQRMGKSDIHCDRIKLILLSAYLDCISDYFLEGSTYESNNFFTTSEIRDVMQHINNICKTNYILLDF